MLIVPVFPLHLLTPSSPSQKFEGTGSFTAICGGRRQVGMVTLLAFAALVWQRAQNLFCIGTMGTLLNGNIKSLGLSNSSHDGLEPETFVR